MDDVEPSHHAKNWIFGHGKTFALSDRLVLGGHYGNGASLDILHILRSTPERKIPLQKVPCLRCWNLIIRRQFVSVVDASIILP